MSKVLSKEPVQRYRTAGQFGRILATYRRRGFDDTDTFAIQRGYTTEFFPRPPRDNRAPNENKQPTPTRNAPIRDEGVVTPPPTSPADELKTQTFVRPNIKKEPPTSDPIPNVQSPKQPTPTRTQSPARQPTPTRAQAPVRAQSTSAVDDPYDSDYLDEDPFDETGADFDWIAVTLGFIALIAVLGLIPLWYAVYLRVLPS